MDIYLTVLCLIYYISFASSQCPPKQTEPNAASQYIVRYQTQCSQSYSKMISVSYTSAYTTSCWSGLWFRCKRTRISYRTVKKTFYRTVNYTVVECKKGYVFNASLMCVPDCPGESCVHGQCIQPNTCQCFDGFIGADCNSVCPPEKYGTNCTEPCSCLNNAFCDNINGSCICTIGWEGVRCEKQCNGTYGEKCAKKCMCENGATCSPVSGECTCKRGYKGKYCQSTCEDEKRYDHNCSRKCECKNGAKCRFTDGFCNCTDGWRGVLCNLPCKNGVFGKDCSKNCDCLNSKSCDPVDGTCNCLPGYHGPQCSPCDGGMFGQSCSQECECVKNNTEKCNHIDGRCDCRRNWNGAKCENPCDQNVTFAVGNKVLNNSCEKQCNNCTVNQGKCEHTTGKCLCFAGFNGTNCELRCKDGTYGVGCRDKCDCVNAQFCSTITGVCQCKEGWTGRKCNTTCDQSHYGVNCQYQCECSEHGVCNRFNGSCQCNDEYQGTYCSYKCSDDVKYKWKYGFGCNQSCLCNQTNTESCHGMTGECTCKLGWEPGHCTSKQKCKGTHFGKGCQRPCKCQRSSVCDSIDGTCTCMKGYYGMYCQFECPIGYYGQDCKSECTCSKNNAKCDHVTGGCTCEKGYMGSKCAQPCEEGRYGAGCSRKCHCQNGGLCNKQNGACYCVRPGWTGEKCNITCSKWTYGLHCSLNCSCPDDNTESCDPVDGKCVCKSGFTGTYCSEICKGGLFGSGCKYNCECDPEHSNISLYCDVQSGNCKCYKGYEGRRCDKVCKDTYFGHGCSHPCPCNGTYATGSCDHVTGRCACLAGYTGFLCNETCPINTFGINCTGTCTCEDCDPDTGCTAKQSVGNKIVIYVVIGPSFIVVFGLLIFVFVICKKRSASKEKGKDKKFNQSITKKQLVNNHFQLQGAENAGLDDDNYQDVNHHKPNPIYESNVDNIQNPIYSAATQYDTLFNKKETAKNTADTYSKLGAISNSEETNNYDSLHGSKPSATKSLDRYDQLNLKQHGHDNVHANAIYDSVGKENNEQYDSLNQKQQNYDTLNHRPESLHDREPVVANPCYDHIGNQNLFNQKTVYDNLNRSSSSNVSKPEESEYAVANVTMYDSLNQGVPATSPSDFFAKDEQYNTLHDSQKKPSPLKQYDHLTPSSSEYEIPGAVVKDASSVKTKKIKKAGKKKKEKPKKNSKQVGRVRYSSLNEEERKQENIADMYAVVDKKKN